MGYRKFIATGGIVCILAFGCGTTVSSVELLRISADQYYQGIRWKAFSQAAALLPPERRAAFLKAREAERETFNVLDYEIHSVEFDVKKENAIVIVDYTWNRLPSTSLEKSRIQQRWQSSKAGWTLVSQEELELPAVKQDKTGIDLL